MSPEWHVGHLDLGCVKSVSWQHVTNGHFADGIYKKVSLSQKEVFIVLEYVTETHWLAGNCTN